MGFPGPTDAMIIVIGDSAVLPCTASDDVTASDGRGAFRMPTAQTWVRPGDRWQCLAGHEGPRTAASLAWASLRVHTREPGDT
jgi:hypothetical protein